MSFIVPFCALLLALLVSIVLGEIGVTPRQKSQRDDVSHYDGW